MPGLEIEPAAPQSQHAAVVVAHLRYANDGDTRPDANTKTEPEPNHLIDRQPTTGDNA